MNCPDRFTAMRPGLVGELLDGNEDWKANDRTLRNSNYLPDDRLNWTGQRSNIT